MEGSNFDLKGFLNDPQVQANKPAAIQYLQQKGIIDAQGNVVQQTSSKPTPQLPSLGGLYNDVIKPAATMIGNAASAGVQKFSSGFNEANTAQSVPGLLEGAVKMGAGALEVPGSIAAPVLAPVGAAVNKIADTVSNSPAVQKFAASPVGQATSKVAENVSNLAEIAGGVAGARQAPVEAAANIAQKAAESVSPYKTTDALKAEAVSNMDKALGLKGKKSVGGFISNDAKRAKGLETLYQQSDGLPVKNADGQTVKFDPTNITDARTLVQAFAQAKQNVWNMVQSALDRGSTVKPNLDPVKAELQKIVDSKGSTGQAISHARDRLAEIEKLDTGNIGDIQQYLQQINSRIGAVLSGASDAIPNTIDAGLAHGLNNALDSALEKVQGAAVRPYKDMYASLKALEPDIISLAQKSARKTGNGLPQYINDFGNINMIDAIFSHNPAYVLTRGALLKATSKILSAERDPLGNMSKAFQAVKQYGGGKKAPEQPPILALPPGVRGNPSKTTGAPISIPPKLQSTIDRAEALNPKIKRPARASLLPPLSKKYKATDYGGEQDANSGGNGLYGY